MTLHNSHDACFTLVLFQNESFPCLEKNGCLEVFGCTEDQSHDGVQWWGIGVAVYQLVSRLKTSISRETILSKCVQVLISILPLVLMCCSYYRVIAVLWKSTQVLPSTTRIFTKTKENMNISFWLLILLLLEHCCPDQPHLRRCLTCWVLIALQSISLHFCIKWLLILSFLSSLKIKLFGHQRASELQNESKIAFNSF